MNEAPALAPTVTDGMRRLAGGGFRMGSTRFYPEEAPCREVEVAPFWIDTGPVTNRQFAAFVRETGYVTVAERPLDPRDYPGAPRARLRPGALVFRPSRTPIPLADWTGWWIYKPGAHWRRPEAGASVFRDRLDHPVTCVAYEDAATYAAWAGKALPTEAQWEFAARGGLEAAEYAWGDAFTPDGRRMANTWTGGEFPFDPDAARRPFRTTPVGRYPANGYGLFDMIGNVWEWTSDWFRTGDEAGPASGCCATPPPDSYDPDAPEIRIPRRVLKGGSFLCAPSYCARYRPAARHAQMIDSASVHIGFRCVRPV